MTNLREAQDHHRFLRSSRSHDRKYRQSSVASPALPTANSPDVDPELMRLLRRAWTGQARALLGVLLQGIGAGVEPCSARQYRGL